MSRPEIRPDDFTPVSLERNGDCENEVMVNAKYDRVDFYRPLGVWMLKFYDDEDGLMTVFTDETNAMIVVAGADLPLVEREFLFQSEYEGYLEGQARILDDAMFGGFDDARIINEAAIEAEAKELEDGEE